MSVNDGTDSCDDVMTTTTSTSRNKHSIPLFERLPPELIEDYILTRFCDAGSLSNLACALSMMGDKNSTFVGSNLKDDDPSTVNHQSKLPSQHYQQSMGIVKSILESSVTAREGFLLENDDVCGGQQPGSTVATTTTTSPYYSELLQLGGRHHSHGVTEHNDDDDGNDDETSYTIYRRLMVLDYCEQLPKNMIWCGRMAFHDLSPPFQFSSGRFLVQVMLLADPPSVATLSLSSLLNTSWSIERVFAWNSVSQRSTTGARVCNPVHGQQRQYLPILMDSYRFVPVGPRGRLCGITSSDRRMLQRIGEHLDETDHVGTLLKVGRYDSPHFTSSFILRIVTYSGARRRLESARLPTDDIEESTDSSGSLLCYWESISAYDDHYEQYGRLTPAQKLGAIRDNLIEYKSFSSDFCEEK